MDLKKGVAFSIFSKFANSLSLILKPGWNAPRKSTGVNF